MERDTDQEKIIDAAGAIITHKVYDLYTLLVGALWVQENQGTADAMAYVLDVWIRDNPTKVRYHRPRRLPSPSKARSPRRTRGRSSQPSQ